MQRGHTVVRTRVDVHSVAGQHPRYPAGVLQRRDMQGCHTVVRARGEVAVAVEQEGCGGRRIARHGTMQRRIAPAVLRPDIRPVWSSNTCTTDTASRRADACSGVTPLWRPRFAGAPGLSLVPHGRS